MVIASQTKEMCCESIKFNITLTSISMLEYIYVIQKARERHFKPIKCILINAEQSPQTVDNDAPSDIIQYVVNLQSYNSFVHHICLCYVYTTIDWTMEQWNTPTSTRNKIHVEDILNFTITKCLTILIIFFCAVQTPPEKPLSMDLLWHTLDTDNRELKKKINLTKMTGKDSCHQNMFFLTYHLKKYTAVISSLQL